MTSGIVCFFDGCCEPKNPGGNMGMGAYIYQNQKEIASHSSFLPSDPRNSCNVAEYLALSWVLNELIRLGFIHEKIFIYGDSNLVINQMNGEWKIKNGLYVWYAKICKELLNDFDNVTLRWIPREQNSDADELSKGHLKKNGVELKYNPL